LKIKEAAREKDKNLFEFRLGRNELFFICGWGFRSIFLYFYRQPSVFWFFFWQ